MSPGVRIESVRLKNRLPAIRLGRHFPQAGNRAFSQVVRLFSVAVHRLPSRKALTSENCGFMLCTKCGPCRTTRKQFSKGLRSKTGVRQRPKNTQKNFFDKQRPGTNFPGLSKISSTGDSVSVEMIRGRAAGKMKAGERLTIRLFSLAACLYRKNAAPQVRDFQPSSSCAASISRQILRSAISFGA